MGALSDPLADLRPHDAAHARIALGVGALLRAG